MTAEETRPRESEGGSTSAVAAPIGQEGTGGRLTQPRSARARLEPERMPQPTRPSRRARHPLVIVGNAILTILLVVGLAAAVGIGIGKQRFEAPGPLEQDKIVNIPRGGLPEVADLLQREGVIEHKWVFVAGVVLMKARDDLKFGEYLFHRKASLRDVVDTVVEGKVVQHQITIPEGLTSEQVVARVLENTVLSGNLKEIPREGTLLPDTYKFTRGYPRDQLIQRMQQVQRRIVQEAWERRNPDLPLKTPEQLLVMASIVEKETGRPDERARVAAVFLNRLKQRMKLQSDPTIIYGLVGGKGTLGRPIMRTEITQPTPYNTYVIDGLPPGPIANPGRASIEAAANPSRTKDLYFVADGNGGHAFSETFAQHQTNVAKLRALEQQLRGDAASPPADAAPADATVTTPAFAPGQAPAPRARQDRAGGARSPAGPRQQ
jgi:peptidoglycan lytic transglycosylase G